MKCTRPVARLLALALGAAAPAATVGPPASALAAESAPVSAAAPGSSEALAREALARGLEALRLNRIAVARRAFTEAVELYPAYPRALYELGRLDALNRRDRQAIELLSKAIAAAPGFVRAHHALGEVHRRAGRLEEAEASFRTALGLKRDDLESLRGLAFVLLARSDEAGGLYLLELAAGLPVADEPVAQDIAADTRSRIEALKADGFAPAMVAIATVRAPAAIAVAAETPASPAEASPAEASPVAPTPQALAESPAVSPDETAPRTGEVDEAQRKVALDGLVASAESHFASQRFSESRAELERARQQAPESASLAYRQGVVLAAMRDFTGARRAWEDALRLGGPRPLVTHHISLVTARADKRALVDARRAWLAGRHAEALSLARARSSVHADRIEADILTSLGMHAEALALWDAALKARAIDRVALAGRAEALVLLGRRHEADLARLAFYAGLEDEGWEPLFLYRRARLRSEVEASLAPSTAQPPVAAPDPTADVPTTLE